MNRNMLISIAIVICVLFCNISYRKINADTYGLIQTIDDEYNPYTNDTFGSAHDKTDGDFLSPVSYSDYFYGLIKTGQDIDYFKFNVYSNSNLTFLLEMMNQDFESSFEYNIALFKRDNSPYITTEDLTLLQASTQSGVYDTIYLTNVTPGSYYLKIFSDNGVGSSRHSYKLNYSIQLLPKISVDFSSYPAQNPNSYIIWSSDFNIGDSKNIINKEIEFANDNNTLDINDLVAEFSNLDSFMNLELYIWGTDLRRTICTLLEQYINELNEIKESIIDDRNVKISIYNVVSATSQVLEIILIFNTGPSSFYISLANSTLSSSIEAFLASAILQLEAENIESIIRYYSELLSALNVGYNTSETEVIVISQKSRFVEKDGKIILKNSFENINSRYVLNYKLQTPIISEIRQYSPIYGDSNYYPIYGKFNYANAELDFQQFLNFNL